MKTENLQYGQSTEILQFIIKSGMLDLHDVQDSMEAMKREELLKKHQYKIWQGQDGKWYTYLPDEKKGRVKKKKSTKREIENVIIEYYKNLKENPVIFKDRYNIWIQRQLDCGVSNNTINRYHFDYVRFFENSPIEFLDISQIDDEVLYSFLINRVKQKELSYRAAKTMFGMLNGIFHKAQKDKIISVNPCDSIDFPIIKKHCKVQVEKTAEERVMSNEQMKLLFDIIAQNHRNKPNYIPPYAIELASLTGMRVGELAGLTWENVNFKEKHILIDRSEKYDREKKEYFIDTTKNAKSRFMPMSGEIEALLKLVKKVEINYGYLCEYVFANENGRIHARVISDCMRNKCIQAGIQTKSIHALRRTFNSKMRCEGVSSIIASSILGHTEKVNNSNYTYDVSDNQYKINVISNINREIMQAVK
ncbi:MAG: site-specific integrase [Lachnospiraceae bacterium]|nr:site-specific integrase [Lachnospiraceae bacterium]